MDDRGKVWSFCSTGDHRRYERKVSCVRELKHRNGDNNRINPGSVFVSTLFLNLRLSSKLPTRISVHILSPLALCPSSLSVRHTRTSDDLLSHSLRWFGSLRLCYGGLLPSDLTNRRSRIGESDSLRRPTLEGVERPERTFFGISVFSLPTYHIGLHPRRDNPDSGSTDSDFRLRLVSLDGDGPYWKE